MEVSLKHISADNMRATEIGCSWLDKNLFFHIFNPMSIPHILHRLILRPHYTFNCKATTISILSASGVVKLYHKNQ